MATYLVFRLYGPSCSWGEIAIGESRHTADHPSRSALLGLFAAALGIERGEEEPQQALSASWRFGLKLLSPGTLLRDYHTVQAPRTERRVTHRTRRQELSAATVNTLLSTREYRQDSVCIVAAEATAHSPWSAEQMQKALLRPRFALYLGRKSCPLAAPLDPRIISCADLREALDTAQKPLAALQRKHIKTLLSDPSQLAWLAREERNRLGLRTTRYFWENGMVPAEYTAAGGPWSPALDSVRHDQPLSRRRWQFSPRREWSYLEPEPTA